MWKRGRRCRRCPIQSLLRYRIRVVAKITKHMNISISVRIKRMILWTYIIILGGGSAHSVGGLPEPPLGNESNESGVALLERGSLPLEFYKTKHKKLIQMIRYRRSITRLCLHCVPICWAWFSLGTKQPWLPWKASTVSQTTLIMLIVHVYLLRRRSVKWTDGLWSRFVRKICLRHFRRREKQFTHKRIAKFSHRNAWTAPCNAEMRF